MEYTINLTELEAMELADDCDKLAESFEGRGGESYAGRVRLLRSIGNKAKAVLAAHVEEREAALVNAFRNPFGK